jgi:hypothetical protein
MAVFVHVPARREADFLQKDHSRNRSKKAGSKSVNAGRKLPISPVENSPALVEWWLTVSGQGFHYER